MSPPPAHEHLASGGYGPPPGGGYGPPPGGGYGPPGDGGFGPPGGGYGPPPGGFGPPGGGYGMPPGAPPGAWGGGAMVAAPYGYHPVTGQPYSDKSKVVAGLLQLFVPCVGRFYTGHTTLALIQLGVIVVTCGAGALWPMVDGILMLMGKVTDSDGRVLRDGT